MSSIDATRAAAELAAATAEPGSRLSRRSMLRGAATAGAAGLAVTAMGVVASPARAAVSQSSSPDQAQDLSTAHAEPIIVHVRDAKTGDIEVFSGEGQTRLRDKDLAARIARAIG
jgi:anaerobic selenocysteine-containing dehydrogenase